MGDGASLGCPPIHEARTSRKLERTPVWTRRPTEPLPWSSRGCTTEPKTPELATARGSGRVGCQANAEGLELFAPAPPISGFFSEHATNGGDRPREGHKRQLGAAKVADDGDALFSRMEDVMKKSVVSLVALIAVSTFACGGASDAPAPIQGPDGGVATGPSGSPNPSSPDGGSVLPGQNPRPDGGGLPPVAPPPPTKPNEITEQFGVFVSPAGQAVLSHR